MAAIHFWVLRDFGCCPRFLGLQRLEFWVLALRKKEKRVESDVIQQHSIPYDFEILPNTYETTTDTRTSLRQGTETDCTGSVPVRSGLIVFGTGWDTLNRYTERNGIMIWYRFIPIHSGSVPVQYRSDPVERNGTEIPIVSVRFIPVPINNPVKPFRPVPIRYRFVQVVPFRSGA
ncbi:hypothetical protein H5410_008057 [Solanum commersonii]|uniref:Uncharacterized protein n=1 Tax=Solanum commersonii TaxID=4109 RepID=A0A9J6AFR8_SOLCO|nr:hypothetical protein H5410_008057 [Solanum commersonii]